MNILWIREGPIFVLGEDRTLRIQIFRSIACSFSVSDYFFFLILGEKETLFVSLCGDTTPYPILSLLEICCNIEFLVFN